MTALSNKVVLITGAGGGFGQQLTRQFLRHGSHLILTDLTIDTLPRNADAISGARGTILGHIRADLADPDAADLIKAQCQAFAPHVDMLINNAGLGLSGLVSEVPQAAWERLMQVNLLAPMRLTAALLPQMIERRSGHLVYISSVAGLIGAPGLSVYSASKFGLRGFGAAVAADTRRFRIRTTIVYPFFARTPILGALHYGSRRAPLPAWLTYDPQTVIAALVRGVQRDALHVYPGAIAWWLDKAQRFIPGVVARVSTQ